VSVVGCSAQTDARARLARPDCRHRERRRRDFGRGAAISLLMLLMVAAMSVFYVRKMVRIGEVQ
jgi:hypothetical protein